MIKKILPATTHRVPSHTNGTVNQNIRNKTISSLKNSIGSNNKALSSRIIKLDEEWDIERVLETNAASIVFLSSILGFKKSHNCWFLLPGTIGFFLLQHALQGWCPPLPILRKFGVRTAQEIENEKIALKFLRGDFSHNTNNISHLFSNIEKK